MSLIIVINKSQESCIQSFLINRLVSYCIFHPEMLCFYKHLIQNYPSPHRLNSCSSVHKIYSIKTLLTRTRNKMFLYLFNKKWINNMLKTIGVFKKIFNILDITHRYQEIFLLISREKPSWKME